MQKHRISEDIPPGTDIPTHEILKNSKLAVAMEYLGLLEYDPQMAQYAEQRGGVIFILVEDGDEYAALTVRDLLSLLPEEE